MTPTQVLDAFHQWAEVHQAVHGEFDVQTRETLFESIAFVATCAQVMDDEDCPACPPKGAPYMADVVGP